MKRLIYTSKEKEHFSKNELEALLVKARHNNESRGVTGLLVYSRGQFVQLLEGPDNSVAEAFRKISLNERHHNIDLIVEESCETAIFSEFRMAFLDLDLFAKENFGGDVDEAFVRELLANVKTKESWASEFLWKKLTVMLKPAEL